MFNSIDEATNWVMSQRKAHQFSDFQKYMEINGNPQLKLKTIHVAGTNGKGSTTNYIRSILQKAGYKVGSFTSPHLVSHLDRIRINDQNIDEKYFLDMVNKYQQQWEEYQLSMFEIDMFISACYFLDQNVDIAVYEVGMGGRLDNTNVIYPIGAVITNIEMDHMQILGDTFEKIAYEKAGIIKEGIKVVTFEKKKEVLNVFKNKCQQVKAKLIQCKDVDNLIIGNSTISYDYLGMHIELPTIASYQVLNSSAAITLIDCLRKDKLIEVSDTDIVEGIKTSWAGRFEKVSDNPLVIIDGAHNENGIEALCQSIDNLHQEVVIVFSALKDKNYHQMLKMLMNKGEVIVTEFDSYRKESAENLAMGTNCLVERDYKKAIELALQKNKCCIITGSLYFISNVREYFSKERKH